MSNIVEELEIRLAVSNKNVQTSNYQVQLLHLAVLSVGPCFIILIESMMGLRRRQGNLRLIFRLFSLMRGLSRIRLK